MSCGKGLDDSGPQKRTRKGTPVTQKKYGRKSCTMQELAGSMVMNKAILKHGCATHEGLHREDWWIDDKQKSFH